jgi:hypothetical protein
MTVDPGSSTPDRFGIALAKAEHWDEVADLLQSKADAAFKAADRAQKQAWEWRDTAHDLVCECRLTITDCSKYRAAYAAAKRSDGHTGECWKPVT